MARVLIVDEEQQIRRFLGVGLGTRGHRVVEADSMAEGLRLGQGRKFDSIILEPGLLDMNGQEVISTIRRRSTVPIIVLSSCADEANKVEALDRGANDYVVKGRRPRLSPCLYFAIAGKAGANSISPHPYRHRGRGRLSLEDLRPPCALAILAVAAVFFFQGMAPGQAEPPPAAAGSVEAKPDLAGPRYFQAHPGVAVRPEDLGVQIKRVAAARGISADQVRQVVNARGRAEQWIDVRMLNQELDIRWPMK